MLHCSLSVVFYLFVFAINLPIVLTDFVSPFTGIMTLRCFVRRSGGRRALVGLIAGAAISLLVLAVTPHPAPFSPRAPPHGLRRIHQEDDDYTAPKPLPAVPSEDATSPKKELPDEGSRESPPAEVPGVSKETAGPFNLPVLTDPAKEEREQQVRKEWGGGEGVCM